MALYLQKGVHHFSPSLSVSVCPSVCIWVSISLGNVQNLHGTKQKIGKWKHDEKPLKILLLSPPSSKFEEDCEACVQMNLQWKHRNQNSRNLSPPSLSLAPISLSPFLSLPISLSPSLSPLLVPLLSLFLSHLSPPSLSPPSLPHLSVDYCFQWSLINEKMQQCKRSINDSISSQNWMSEYRSRGSEEQCRDFFLAYFHFNVVEKVVSIEFNPFNISLGFKYSLFAPVFNQLMIKRVQKNHSGPLCRVWRHLLVRIQTAIAVLKKHKQ